MSGIKNAMTIDVEDYFQVGAFENIVTQDSWSSREVRVEQNTRRILDIFQENGVKATFFILGWVAENFPQVIKAIANDGHEVASHGMDHRRVTALSKSEFSEDLARSKKILEDVGGQEVFGYRAPSFSFTKENLWVYEKLAEHGYRYSSSVYPVKHDHYGIPDASRFVYQAHEKVLEIPMSTLVIGSKNIPISGGGFFRLYPYFLTKWAVNKFNNVEAKPFIFYLHPWEVDPNQPRIEGASRKSLFRHYLNLSKTDGRLCRLSRDFAWDTMKSIYLDNDEN